MLGFFRLGCPRRLLRACTLSPSVRDTGAAQAGQLRLAGGWLQPDGHRICAGGINWAIPDAAALDVLAGAPRAADFRRLLQAPEAGYTYKVMSI